MKTKKTKMQRINAFVSKSQYKEVSKMAVKKGITFSELLRRSIEFYLDDQYEKYRKGERK